MTERSAARIVFLDRGTLAPQIALPPFAFDCQLVNHDFTAEDEVDERIAEADIVIVNKTVLTAGAIRRAKRLKMIAVAATGTDNVDVAACHSSGIVVSNVREYAVNTVPEHTFALIFALRRSVLAYRDAVRAGRWSEVKHFCFFDYPIRDLAGSTIGIIGDGALGRAVAKMATALSLRVMFAAYKGRSDMGPLYTPFDEVMRLSDIITLHCPLNSFTRNMLGDREFNLMDRAPMIINTARGGLVDEAALARAMASGRISGAGFDVCSIEPPAPDHVLSSLLGMPNFILTPHVAWASDEAMQALASQVSDNVNAFWRNQPRNVVVPVRFEDAEA